jgi:hypothetical protein
VLRAAHTMGVREAIGSSLAFQIVDPQLDSKQLLCNHSGKLYGLVVLNALFEGFFRCCFQLPPVANAPIRGWKCCTLARV